MTISLDNLPETDAPLYQRLAEGLAAHIADGSLAVGARLPTQRELASALNTTVGTVGRAYTLLRERGLVSGEVGRGTFVLRQVAATSEASVPPTPNNAEILARLDEISTQVDAIRALLADRRSA